MWLAAAYDLLVFFFGMAALLCWVRWLRSDRWCWYAAALASILLAAISKETFWVFVLLMLVITIYERRKDQLIPALLSLSPFLVVLIA